MTEQYYLKARFYNPAVARFTQEDTYYGDGLNLYAYCHNNPVSYVDPTGHEAKAAAEKNPGSTSQRTPDQQALFDLVDEQNKLGGHDSTDQKTIRDWADKYGVDYDDLGVKLKESGTSSLYRKMSEAEYSKTISENQLQGQIPGKDSSKWLSESYDKVVEFNNLAVQPGTKEYIVEFQMSDEYMKYLQNTAIPQKGSKGMDNVKFHYEGLEIDGPYKNYGIPESQRNLFNKNIVKIITRSGKND